MSSITPKQWHATELGTQTNKIEGGGTPPRNNPSYWNGEIPWCTVKDLKGVYLSSTEESISAVGLNSSSSKLIAAKTVIIATRMAVGKAVVFDKDVAINQDLKAIHLRPSMTNDYFLQWYLANSEMFNDLGTGSTVKGIRIDDLVTFPLLLPPLPEQKKIATILLSIDTVIEKTQAQIDKLNDLKTGMMQELLTKGIGPDGKPHTEFKDSPVGRIPIGWTVVKLSSVCSLITKGATPTTQGHEYADAGVKFYRSINASKDGTLQPADTKYVTEEAIISLKRSRLALGDLAISIVGAKTGRTFFCVTKTAELPANINQNIALVRPKSEKLNSSFLKYIFTSNDFQHQVDMEITTQAQPSLSLKQVGDFELNLPPLEEQITISEKLDSISQLTRRKKTTLKSIRNVKKALMQDLLTGKVRVNPDPE